MDTTLNKWDTIITEELHPETIVKNRLNAIQLNSYRQQFESEKRIIRKFLLNESFEKQEKETELLIQRTQSVLIALQDNLDQYCKIEDIETDREELYKFIRDQIQFLLDFIESDFRKYFNIDEKVPASYLEISKTELGKQYEPVKVILASRAELDKTFVYTLHQNMERFTTEENEVCTYRDLIYHKELIKELHSLGKLSKTDCMYSALKELLIYMDFNSPYFINYFLSQFKSCTSVEELAQHLKEISLMHIKPGFRLYPNRPSVKQSLTEALQKEINFLQTLGAEAGDRDLSHRERIFVIVPFKGAEIYLLVKSFIDSGGALGELYKTLLEKIAPFLANKTQKGFSAESLGKHSDKVDPNVKENVKRFLQKMIRNIESYD
jgi:hypothetical protein